MWVKSWMIVVCALSLAACGKNNEENNEPGQDMGGEDSNNNNGMTDMAPPDDAGNNLNNNDPDLPDPTDMPDPEDMAAADMTADGGGDAGADMADMPDEGGPCTYNTFVPVMQTAVYEDDPNLEFFEYSARDAAAGMPYGNLRLQVFPAFGGVIGAQTFTFTGENYDSCNTCLLGYQCDAGGACSKEFLVQSGSVTIAAAGTTAGDAFTATFNNLMFIQVTIDPATFTATPVPNGETWCVQTFDASATTTIAP